MYVANFNNDSETHYLSALGTHLSAQTITTVLPTAEQKATSQPA